ncbi:hypothetical protein PTW35_11810 [Photobacterium sp. DA100]|uniref:hypothetical protein n=1 Tax=Photobacterium sp. DA100 TaxID=3027472 RepID=UPI002479BA04|nr:hypothetical protein [Photobacterium sp. DA100]WEM41315.1 hypothetical protein PTW35_11810 [Photobacterium sp. DA100]
MTPLKYILETRHSYNTNTDQLMTVLSHTAIGVCMNKPLDRGRWIQEYLIKIKPTLTPLGSAWKLIEACLKESTPNRIARTFETFYLFYWGSSPYAAARPLPGQVERANARIEAYCRLKESVLANTTPPQGYMALAS